MADQQNNVDFNFSFTPFKEYQPYTGEGGSDPFPFDGFVCVKPTSIVPYFTRAKDGQPSKPAVKVHGVAQDDDAKGLRIIGDVLCGGKDKNGEDLGRHFIDLLLSSGTPLENIHRNAQSGAEGSIKAITKPLLERMLFAEVEADVFDGNPTTRIKNWVTKERYEQSKLAGAYRRPRRTVNAGANTGFSVGGAGAAGATANGAAPTQAPAQGASTLPML